MAEVKKLGGQEKDLATKGASSGTDRPSPPRFLHGVAFLAGSGVVRAEL